MATVYASANDGFIKSQGTSSWDAIRNATSGSADSTTATGSLAISAAVFAGRGTTTYRVHRAFFDFDTSGITDTLASATLYIQGTTFSGAKFYVLKGTQSASLANSDFNSIHGWISDGTYAGTGIAYAAEVTSWDDSDYNSITLNATALSDMVSLDTFKICCIESRSDAIDVEPSDSSAQTGMLFSETSSTSRDPYIDYSIAVAADNATFFGANF